MRFYLVFFDNKKNDIWEGGNEDIIEASSKKEAIELFYEYYDKEEFRITDIFLRLSFNGVNNRIYGKKDKL